MGHDPTTLRNATRVKSFFADDKSTWDGKARSPATGKEYVIDLGEGYTGIYRPYAGHDPKKEDYSLRGSLELIAPAPAPAGAGHGRALVERLGRMNLVNRPMTKAEGERAYLASNIEAQGLLPDSGVSKALSVAAGVDEQLWTRSLLLMPTRRWAWTRRAALSLRPAADA
jgi:hypothetical protein